MTTLYDMLNDLIKEATDIKQQAANKQSEQLDDDMQELDEIEEEMQNDLLEQYMTRIKNRLIG